MALSLNLPDLLACVQLARAAFRAYLPGANAWAWPNNVAPSAKVIGAAQWQGYQHLDYAARQAFALFAEGKNLDIQGNMLNLPRKLAAASAGNVLITVSGAAAMAAGGQIQRADNTLYTATGPASTASAGVLTVPVLGPAGLAYNTAENTPMTIVSGLTGVGATGATAAVDSSGLTGGLDIEPDGEPETRDLSTYRGRILFRKANPPQGGAPADYVQWAGEVTGVTRVFVERRWAGAGTVRVFPIFDQLFASTGGIADGAHIALVADLIAPLAPAGANVAFAAPVAQPVSVAISNLSPSTAAAQAAVLAEIADAFQMYGRVSGSDAAVASMPYLASPFSMLADWIEGAVRDAPGVIGADVSVADTAISEGCIPTPSVTFS
jgi:uncharacterized phage protein gp47/JayE